MAITESDFEWRKALNNSDTDSNGGRMGTAAIVHNVKNNLLPDITQTQRVAGLTRYRKLFALVLNVDDLSLQNGYAHLSRVSQGDDFFTLFAGTQRDTQAGIATPRMYAIAPLSSNPAAGGAVFTLTLEDASLASCFVDGDSIWIGDDENGEYFHNVDFETSGTSVTVTLNTGNSLATGYAAGDARCATLLPVTGDVAAGVSDWSETSATGTYDESAHPVEVNNIGCSEDDWLLTFTTSTAFTVSGTYAGELAAGDVSVDYAPANAAEGGVYFTMRAAGWGGTWQPGDTVSFSTHPASLPLWLRETVPAGAAAISASVPEVTITGESS